jgi:hypothetical protein
MGIYELLSDSCPGFPTASAFYKLVASRSVNTQDHEPTGNDVPSPLKRLLIRLAIASDSERVQAVTRIKRDLESALQPLADGPHISVGITDKTYNFDPRPTGNHWDEGAMDFADDQWEYAT